MASSPFIRLDQPAEVRCPTCGQPARRQYIAVSSLSESLTERCNRDDWILRTSCSTCDYLMSFCPCSGAVIEAYTF